MVEARLSWNQLGSYRLITEIIHYKLWKMEQKGSGVQLGWEIQDREGVYGGGDL